MDFVNPAGTLTSNHPRAQEAFLNPRFGIFPTRVVSQHVYTNVTEALAGTGMDGQTLKHVTTNFGTVGGWTENTFRVMRRYVLDTMGAGVATLWIAHYWWAHNPNLGLMTDPATGFPEYSTAVLSDWLSHIVQGIQGNVTASETLAGPVPSAPSPSWGVSTEPESEVEDVSDDERFNRALWEKCRTDLLKSLGSFYGSGGILSYLSNAIGIYRDNKEAGWPQFRALGGVGFGSIAEVHKEAIWHMAVKYETTKKKIPVVSILELPFKKAFSNYKKVKAVKGEIGLEIEAEGENLFRSPIQYWHAVGDGSLRQYKGHDPIEYVLREPLPRDQIKEALEYLSNRLKGAKSHLVMSHRCSVHVHVNCQPMKVKDLINYMALYYIFEDTLVGWAAPERRGNLFALRAKDAEYQVELLTQALKQGTWAHLFNTEYRYGAMNVSSLSVHGSLEFRAMRGTVDIKTIHDWVTILLALKDAAGEFKTPESISRMFKSMGPRAFMIHVLDKRVPPKILKDWLDSDTTEHEMWDGYREVRDVLHAIDWNDPPGHMFKPVSTKMKSPMPSLDEE